MSPSSTYSLTSTMKAGVCSLLLLVSGVSGFTLPGAKQRSNGFTISKSTELSSAASDRRDMIKSAASALVVASGFGLTSFPDVSEARLEGVNRPELLPSEPGKNVIQVEKFLTTGQAKRMDEKLTKLEQATGYRVRVLCQSYPQTPGLAIRDYWDLGKPDSKDDKYVVLVVDQFGGKGNVLNFNVGEGVKFALPNVFWTRLQGKYGSLFFVKENGIDSAIENAIDAIYTCLRSEDAYCINVPDAALDLQTLK